MVGKILTQFLSFFLLPLYTRFLPASDYGLVDLLLTYISLLAPVVTVQQEMATFRFLIDARDDEKKKATIIKTSFKNSLTRLLIFIIPCTIVALFIKWHYIYLILIAGIAMSISNLLLQIARGVGNNTKYSIASVLSGVVTITSNLLLICVFHFGAESILIPEVPYDFNKDVLRVILDGRNTGKKHYIVIVAEGVGHAEEIAKQIEEATGIEARPTILGHLQRGGSPTLRDRTMASLMGIKAIDCLVEKRFNRLIVQQHGEISDVDIEEGLAMTKTITPDIIENIKRLG